MTFFGQNWRSFNKQQGFCKSNEMAGSQRTRLLIEGLQPRLAQKSMLPTFAKAPCCLELFGCCCRRLSQHGVGEVLIPLRHCWRDAFFRVCVGSGSFCHDLASHCSVLFWSLDALFVFWAPPFAPPGLLCRSDCICGPQFNVIPLKNNSVY